MTETSQRPMAAHEGGASPRRRRPRPVRPRVLAGAAGGTVGAQLTVVALWAVAIFPGAEVPAEVAAAFAGLATAGLGFAAAYYHRDAE